MLIANPIYDTVFKYLMEDSPVAKRVLSTILDAEILALELRPQERTSRSLEHSIQIYRIDFAAKIKTRNGEEKNVLIELQKARNSTDLMRFRRYLGEQYTRAELMPGTVESEEEGQLQPLPIITIYILGYTLENIDVPVLHVNRHYTDQSSGERLEQTHEFIENLTHDSYVIQIPRLKHNRRNKLEKLLSIFDQTQVKSDRYILNLEESLPKEYTAIVNRLAHAVMDDELREQLELEEEVDNLIESREREYLNKLEKKDQAIEKKDQVIEEKKQVIEAKDKALAAQRTLIEELTRKLEQ